MELTSLTTAVETRLSLLERERLETLLNLSQAFNSSMELDALLPRILDLTLEVTESEAGAVWLVDNGMVRCAVTAGPAAALLTGATVALGEGAVGEVVASGTTLVVENALNDERFEAYRRPESPFAVRSAVVIPLRVRGRSVGAIELVNDLGGKEDFTEADIAFLEALADDAGAAVRNAELYGHERRARHFQTELNLFGQVFVIVIVMLAIGIALSAIVSRGVSPGMHVTISWVSMLLFLVPILFFARYNRIPLVNFGVTAQRWKRWALEGALLAVPLILTMPISKRLLYGDTGPLITWDHYASYPTWLTAFDLITYLPHIYLEELAARGLVQGSLQRFMVGAHPLVPVLVASSLFGVGHLYVGFSFALLTLVMSFTLGVLYLRQGSLVGVVVTHFLCGLAGLAFGLF